MIKHGGIIRKSVVTILFATFLISLAQISNVSATTSTITLSIANNVSINISPSESGTFASSTATNNVRVKTDNASGYELGIKASTSGSNNNALINTNDSSKIIPSITSSISEATYSSSSTYNNTWGFKPSKLNSQANSNYIPGPNSTTNLTVIDKTTTANPSFFNDYTITLGTRIDNTQTPGAYANTFVITAVANPTPYTITYNKNTTDTVTNMPDNVSSETFSDQVTISNQVPARDGYNFKGWCTVQVADGGTCTGTTYNPDGGGTDLTWTLDQTVSSNSLTLYAMWEVGKIYMQDLTLADCTTTPLEVYDKRDEEAYKVAKLADGKCWMLDNLRLDLTNSTILNGLTTSNTHVDSTSLTSLKSGNRSAGAQYASSGFANWNSSSPSNAYNQAKANADYKDTTTTSYGAGSGKIGVYYNYCAASAGSYCYDENAATGNASYDLCPAGWRMPTGAYGEYQALYTAYSSNPTNFKNALSTPLSGRFHSGSASNQGTDGYFWSSTYDYTILMFDLHVSSSGVDPFDYDGRPRGYSVRCLLGKTMQDVGSWESQVGAGEETTALDTRDGAEYTVARLSDGNLWMTQNLRFTGGKLKVGESDVTSDITMTYGQLTSGNSYTEPRIATGSTTDYGTYYNYCAVSAGEVCNDTTQQDATRSVCPAGWKLPTQAQLNALPQKESHFIASSGLAGFYLGGSLSSAGTLGFWWASTAGSATNQYVLYYRSDYDLWFVSSDSKLRGNLIRCVRAS